MAKEERIVTTKVGGKLLNQLDTIAERIDRPKSWIVREALTDWLAEEERRYQMTLEALAQVDAGQTYTHEEVGRRLAARQKARGRARDAA